MPEFSKFAPGGGPRAPIGPEVTPGYEQYIYVGNNSTTQAMLPELLDRLRKEGVDPQTKFGDGLILVEYY